MNVKVLLFGLLADKAGVPEVTFKDVKDLDELRRSLLSDYPFLEDMSYFIALNREVVNENAVLTDGDEVALMPPYAGG